MKLTNVYIEWADGEQTVESFESEEQFYSYLKETENEINMKAKNWKSDNAEWSF